MTGQMLNAQCREANGLAGQDEPGDADLRSRTVRVSHCEALDIVLAGTHVGQTSVDPGPQDVRAGSTN